MRGQLATVPLLAPRDIFVSCLRSLRTEENTLPPEYRGDIEGAVFNLEAVTAKKCGEEGKSVVKVYVSTGRTYTNRTLQYAARERKRISG
jgi:hypothetical protein